MRYTSPYYSNPSTKYVHFPSLQGGDQSEEHALLPLSMYMEGLWGGMFFQVLWLGCFKSFGC